MLNYICSDVKDYSIIFIHGNSQSSKHWTHIFESDLSSHFRLIAPDLPGCGLSFRSNQPEIDYSIKGISNHLLTFIQEFNDKPYILVGNSLGTNLIAEIVLKLPNCKGIFLTGSCCIGQEIGIDRVFQLNPNLGAYFTGNPDDKSVNKVIDESVFECTEKSRQLVFEMFLETDSKLRESLAIELTQPILTDHIGNINKSELLTAVVFGREEKLINTNYLEGLISNKWRNETVLISKSGHFSAIDQPDELRRLIFDFAKDCFKI